MSNRINLFQIYIQNNCRLGFFVTRDSWSNRKFAKVIKIDGVTDGEMINGVPPYFNRKYHVGHPRAGKIWPRLITLKADWFENGIYVTDCGGNYCWAKVDP